MREWSPVNTERKKQKQKQDSRNRPWPVVIGKMKQNEKNILIEAENEPNK